MQRCHLEFMKQGTIADGYFAYEWLAALALGLFGTLAQAQTTSPPVWVGSWATSQQVPESRDALPAAELTDATLRQIVHLSIGGRALRVHLSNAFGTEPLHVSAAHVARAQSAAAAAIVPATDAALTFDGRADVTVPAGAEYISDPVVFAAAPQADLAISLYLETPPARQTGHPGARTDTYLVHGNRVSAEDLPRASKVQHWFDIGGVDVEADPGASAVVALGDSITDGRGSTTNGNDRWTDDLARRLLEERRKVSVLNLGLGGGRVLNDGSGPNALARFDRDVLAQAGVRYLILFEGINDIGTFDRAGARPRSAHDALVRDLTGAFAQIVERAHAAGIKVYGATLTPFADCTAYHPVPAAEADRRSVNAWIRAPGHFDAVLDFDAVVRDPERPDHLAADDDSGDHLHPSAAGYHALADSIPLSLFAE
jgi:lysophospholipase L1-like esterase